MFVRLVIFACVCRLAVNFNLEERNFLFHKGEKGSYFGYSVAQHITDKDKDRGESWLLVGAPLGQNLQPLTNRSGALFKCPITSQENCEQIRTDGRRPEDEYDEEENDQCDDLCPPNPKEELKDGQWLGVDVKSQGPGGVVMVCAHRYAMGNKDVLLRATGLCYSLHNSLDFNEPYEPCKGRPMNNEHEQFGACQAGTSIAVLDDGTAVIGSPGPYTWRGTIFVQSIVGDFLHKDQSVYLGPLDDNDKPIGKYSYLGMSVTGGYFLSNKKKSYAAGAPRSQDHGQVYFFDKPLQRDKPMDISLIIDGDQFGSNFGYTILSTDLDNNGFDDLIVSAPFYFSKNHGGAVYVYSNLTGCEREQKCSNQTIYGPSESRFGFSMAALGDINKDGYRDIAIGAPYEGGGAIYIYLGSRDGLKLSQKIHPEKDGITTIGYSLSGGLDMDNNGYPDLLTGAYASDVVILYRTRPIIDFKIDVIDHYNELKNINPKIRGCRLEPRSNHTCFHFELCFNIVDDMKSNLQNVSVLAQLNAETFDNKKKFSRVWFKKQHKHTFHNYVERHHILEKGRYRYCQNETVYLQETRDILSPIRFLVNYTLDDSPPDSPILNQTSVKEFEATFQKDCGSDDVCQSRLVLSAVLPDLNVDNEGRYDLTLGKTDEIILQVNVTNNGESAYETELFIIHPNSLNYIALGKSDEIKCTTKNSTMVTCSLGNPVPNKESISLNFRFESNNAVNAEKELTFYTFVNSTSTELSKKTNATLIALIQKVAEVKIKGLASSHILFGGEIRGETAMKHFDDIGKKVWHKYQVVNHGPWHVENLQVLIKWPLEIENNRPHGKWLLYLESLPKVEGNDKDFCYTEALNAVNVLNLTKRAGSTESPPENLMLPREIPKEFETQSVFLQPQDKTRRRRRDAEFRKVQEDLGDQKKRVTLDCDGTAKCITLICNLHQLGKDQDATITVESRLWNSTLMEDYANVEWVKIISMAQIFLKDSTIMQNVDDDFAKAETVVFPEIRTDDSLNLLVIIGAVLAGLLLLTILIVILYKCGFFKRNRVKDPTLQGNLQKQNRESETLLPPT
ncbi:integrin alpha-PS1 isoform X2 [Onthophagus taurus]|uniref:integrin alpha-PS1 isoform X2 n=1 Tax=Onthophagus taurus TaxID=166361 RepID=UPI000C1FF00F|nr:integrin alpha-PS1 isoform X2 [Onthophagus taurus]